MVGEIRDAETGEIAINAALTGHLVSQPCTPTAPSAVTTHRHGHQALPRRVVSQAIVAATCQEDLRASNPTPTEIEVEKGISQFEWNKRLMSMAGLYRMQQGLQGAPGNL